MKTILKLEQNHSKISAKAIHVYHTTFNVKQVIASSRTRRFHSLNLKHPSKVWLWSKVVIIQL